MAEFTPKKIVLGDINKGIEFTESDGVTPNAINDPIEAVAYAQTVVEHLTDTPDTSEINGTGEPNVSFVSGTAEDGVPIYKFKFSNLSGATFTPSLDEAGNLSWSNNRNLPNPPTINISGRDYLFSSEVLSGTYIPQVNSEVTDMPLTSFNRAPVDDIDHCYLFYYYTPENIYYWLATQVVDIQETTATLKILSVVRLTGYTPTIGENGNWFIGGDDTGKPSYGASGVTDVVAGASYNQNDFTVTPLTFNFEVGNSKTVNVKAAIGNVEDGSYAKLEQVVRVDTAQSLTDAQKNTVAQNIERSAWRSVNSGEGWYNILTADTDGYFVADLSVTSGWNNQEPTEVKIIAIGGYTVSGLVDTRASITCFSGGALSPFISKVRVRKVESQTCIDIYIPYNTTTYFNTMSVMLNSWEAISNTMPQVQPFTFIGTEDDAADNVSICEVIPKGISTNGQIYQQGSPVLVGDQSAIFESNGTTVKNATNAINADKATKATQDANGNVFDTTYAKLSQVVRKDALVGAIDPTTGEGKNWLANKQVMTSGKNINASGWYRIALIPNYCKVKFNIFKQFNYDVGTATTITINSGIALYGYVLINVENSMAGDSPDNYVKQVRFSGGAPNTPGYVDVYIEAAGANLYWLAVDAEKVYNTDFEIYAFDSVTEAVADNAIIVDVPKNGGSNTNKPIYQQGSPVLVGTSEYYLKGTTDGTNESVKLTSAGWYCINYKGTSAAPSYSTGVFYWNGYATYLPVSAFLLGSIVTKRAINIGSDGTLTVFSPDSETPAADPNFTVEIYKLA